MSRLAQLVRLIAVSLLATSLAFCNSASASAAEKSKIDAAIFKSQQFLVKQKLTGPQGAIACLAYLKSGGDKKAETVQNLVLEVIQKVHSGKYHPVQHHNYEAGVDLMLLEAIDIELYRPQMEMMVDYLLASQQPNGAWFYPHDVEPDCGDTSITQYALLGLWAASRAGIPVPTEVWEKAARWHLSKQRDDGGFAYTPFDRKSNPDPELKRSSGTMTAAGSSNLLIVRRILFSDADQDFEVRPAETKRRFGALERFVDEKPGGKTVLLTAPTLRPAAIDKALKESIRWIGIHLGEKEKIHAKNHEQWFCYHYYCLERVAALLDVDKLGNHDWYDEGADELLLRQSADGSWNDQCTNIPSTALSLMFLSKATTTIVTPRKSVALVGGGLQIGGRGLPNDLEVAKLGEGNAKARKIVDPVDKLLIELDRASDAKVEDVQAAIVEAVQLDHPEQLIGQMDRLRRLAADQRIEVRRTAIWALGRSGDISAATLLITALDDQDQSVMIEASRGLSTLSRRPEGIGKPIDPTVGASDGDDGLTDEERKTRLDQWRSESKQRWWDWYQRIRPYSERDDRTSLRKSAK